MLLSFVDQKRLARTQLGWYKMLDSVARKRGQIQKKSKEKVDNGNIMQNMYINCSEKSVGHCTREVVQVYFGISE